MADYRHPEVLVSTEWVAENLNAPNTRLVESGVDTTGVRPGAYSQRSRMDWQTPAAGQCAA